MRPLHGPCGCRQFPHETAPSRWQYSPSANNATAQMRDLIASWKIRIAMSDDCKGRLRCVFLLSKRASIPSSDHLPWNLQARALTAHHRRPRGSNEAYTHQLVYACTLRDQAGTNPSVVGPWHCRSPATLNTHIHAEHCSARGALRPVLEALRQRRLLHSDTRMTTWV